MNIALIGYGKMGKMVEDLAISRGHTITCTVTSDGEDWKPSDVAIEFSRPEAAMKNFKHALENGFPIVTGTTGWYEGILEVRKMVREHEGRFFYASNFSMGMNILFQVNERLAELIADHPQYRPRIHEVHHTEKKDSPSGTAITLAADILDHSHILTEWKNEASTDEHVLPIISERIGKEPGLHEVIYEGETDILSLKHEAKNRQGFALGAILAAEWLVKCEPGTYGMKDLLKHG